MNCFFRKLGFVYVEQGNVIQLFLSVIFFWGLSWLNVWVDGVSGWSWCLAGGKGWWLRPGSRSQVKVKYFIIVYSSTSIRFPHLCQEYHDSFVTANDRGMRALGMVHVRAWAGKKSGIIFFLFLLFFWAVVNCSFMTGAWYLVHLFFVPLLMFFVLLPPSLIPLLRHYQHTETVVFVL